eukprot:Hpha_TRINITY_DN12105_c0_g1::TRINITY_DN12105_c0_g1_i1::g.82054::m.82054
MSMMNLDNAVAEPPAAVHAIPEAPAEAPAADLRADQAVGEEAADEPAENVGQAEGVAKTEAGEVLPSKDTIKEKLRVIIEGTPRALTTLTTRMALAKVEEMLTMKAGTLTSTKFGERKGYDYGQSIVTEFLEEMFDQNPNVIQETDITGAPQPAAVLNQKKRGSAKAVSGDATPPGQAGTAVAKKSAGPTAYHLYCEAEKQKAIKDGTPKPARADLHARWKELKEEDKAPFKEAAKKEMGTAGDKPAAEKRKSKEKVPAAKRAKKEPKKKPTRTALAIFLQDEEQVSLAKEENGTADVSTHALKAFMLEKWEGLDADHELRVKYTKLEEEEAAAATAAAAAAAAAPAAKPAAAAAEGAETPPPVSEQDGSQEAADKGESAKEADAEADLEQVEQAEGEGAAEAAAEGAAEGAAEAAAEGAAEGEAGAEAEEEAGEAGEAGDAMQEG